MGKIRYIWLDANDEEHITKEPPDPIQGCMGGWYTPDYRRVMIIEIEDEEN
jgi:hypothetical protein